MRRKLLIVSLIAAILLILGLPIAVGAQGYNRYYDDQYYSRYDDRDARDVRDALRRLDSASARLENELNYTRGRRVLGFFWVRDDNAAFEARDFHRAVRNLWNRSNGGRDLDNSYGQAQALLDEGARLDRDLRFQNNFNVSSELAEIRANLETIANAYGLDMNY